MLKAMPESEQPTSASKWVLTEVEPAVLPFDPYSRVPFVRVIEILRNLLSPTPILRRCLRSWRALSRYYIPDITDSEESGSPAAEDSSDNDPGAD